MRKLVTMFLLLGLMYNENYNAQLSGHNTDEDWFWAVGVSAVTMKNKSLVVPTGGYKGDKFSYLGFHTMFSHDSYEQWGFRYQFDMKWFPDLAHKAFELGKGVGLSPRLDFTGFTNHKIGFNILGSNIIAIGVGGSFCDYIVDIPNWKSTPNFNSGGFTWQEPSGWHWTAGPAVFIDGGIGDFTANMILSYDISYFRPKVTDEYEEHVDKMPGGYPRVGFMYLDITINHESGLYLSYDRTRLIDKGINANKFSRGDLQLGYKILL